MAGIHATLHRHPSCRPLIARLTWALALAFALVIGSSVDADDADAKGATKAATKSSRTKRGKRHRVCKRVKGKLRCKKIGPNYSGHAPDEEALQAHEIKRGSGEVWVYAENLREEVKVNIYNEDGSLNDEALAELDSAFRCKRTKETRAVDPRLYELLSVIYDHFGQKRITLVSGFRYQRNESSRHFHASAMDIRIPGVSMHKLAKFANTLDTGGMGIGRYPRTGFVHIDMRAPGEKSYRWTDRSRPGRGGSRGKRPSRQWVKRSKRPNS